MVGAWLDKQPGDVHTHQELLLELGDGGLAGRDLLGLGGLGRLLHRELRRAHVGGEGRARAGVVLHCRRWMVEGPM